MIYSRNVERLEREIEFWKTRMREADACAKRELAFILWGIASGLVIARDIVKGNK